MSMSANDPARQFLRHTLATLAYRVGKPLRDVPEGFAQVRAGEGTRTAVELLAHMGDLFDWSLTKAVGKEHWNSALPLPWEQECARFFAALTAFDQYLASDAPVHASAEELFQGPIADALTHTGQLAQLRRLAGAPVRSENYSKATITAGATGASQAPPKFEF